MKKKRTTQLSQSAKKLNKAILEADADTHANDCGQWLKLY